MHEWRVVHRFARPLAVVNEVQSYPAMGIDLSYDGGKLIAVVHTFSTDAQDRSSVIDASRVELEPFLDVLQYWWGSPIYFAESTPQQLSTNHADSARGPIRGVATARASAAIARPIRLPPPQRLQSAPSRLRVWLRLAIDASEVTSAADAVRNYYMIWEDKNGRPDAAAPNAFRLKLIRDFVSHGEPLKNQDVLGLLKKELGVSVSQYDPTDPAHRQLVEGARAAARALIEAEINPLLS